MLPEGKLRTYVEIILAYTNLRYYALELAKGVIGARGRGHTQDLLSLARVLGCAPVPVILFGYYRCIGCRVEEDVPHHISAQQQPFIVEIIILLERVQIDSFVR